MTTSPFDRVSLQPASPAWIVRQIPDSAGDVEIVYVGHANRMELDSSVERLARVPWNARPNETIKVTVLADARAEMIGVRIEGCSWDTTEITKILEDMFGGQIVAHALRANHARKLLTGKF